MTARYIIDLAVDHFSMASFFSMYCDNGNVVFEGNQTCDKLQNWLHELHDHVGVHTKPGFGTRYLNIESSHTNAAIGQFPEAYSFVSPA